MSPRKSLTVVLAAAALAQAACLIPIYVDDPGRFGRWGEAFQRTIALEPGRAITLDAGLGDIEIRGWEKNEVEVFAAEDWAEADGRRSWMASGRGAVTPRVEMEKTADGSLRIKARSRDESLSEDRAVRLVIRVPHSVDLEEVRAGRGQVLVADVFGKARVRLDEGDVRFENCSGSLEVELDRGSVEAELLDLRPEDVVRISIRQGPITLFLEPSVAAAVELNAPNGRLACEFDRGTPVSGTKAAGRIGGTSGAAVRLTSLNGDVSVLKAK